MMRVPKPPHSFIPFPRTRLAAIDFIDEASRQNTVFALGQVDITETLHLMGQHQDDTAEKLSLTAYVVRCVAKAIDDQKEIAAYRKGNRGLVVFEDVDVGVLIERVIDGTVHPTMHFVAKANTKSFETINEELQRARDAPLEQDMLIEKKRTSFLLLPRFLRLLMLRMMRRNPFVKKFAAGTVAVTSLGMFERAEDKRRCWPIPLSAWTITVAIGPYFRAPAVVGDDIVPRTFLPLTGCFDHDVVDGGPAARFSRRCADLIEAGFELPGGPTEVA